MGFIFSVLVFALIAIAIGSAILLVCAGVSSFFSINPKARNIKNTVFKLSQTYVIRVFQLIKDGFNRLVIDAEAQLTKENME